MFDKIQPQKGGGSDTEVGQIGLKSWFSGISAYFFNQGVITNMSPRFNFNQQDLQTIYAILLHGLIGIVVTLISEVLIHINYGNYTPIITMGLSWVSLTLTKWLSGPTSDQVKIQQLEEVIANLQGNSSQNTESAKEPQVPLA